MIMEGREDSRTAPWPPSPCLWLDQSQGAACKAEPHHERHQELCFVCAWAVSAVSPVLLHCFPALHCPACDDTRTKGLSSLWEHTWQGAAEPRAGCAALLCERCHCCCSPCGHTWAWSGLCTELPGLRSGSEPGMVAQGHPSRGLLAPRSAHPELRLLLGRRSGSGRRSAAACFNRQTAWADLVCTFWDCCSAYCYLISKESPN